MSSRGRCPWLPTDQFLCFYLLRTQEMCFLFPRTHEADVLCPPRPQGPSPVTLHNSIWTSLQTVHFSSKDNSSMWGENTFKNRVYLVYFSHHYISSSFSLETTNSSRSHRRAPSPQASGSSHLEREPASPPLRSWLDHMICFG